MQIQTEVISTTPVFSSQQGQAKLGTAASNELGNEIVVRISDAGRLLEAASAESVYDPHQLNIFGKIVDATSLPVQAPETVRYFPFTDEASFKALIKEEFFMSRGIYVDDAYVNAFYDHVTDINSPLGPAPDMDLPEPPDWWTGYRPMKA